MNIRKIKPILPSLREKKRYLKYEVVSNNKLTKESTHNSIISSLKSLIGDLGMAESGSRILKKVSDEKNGIIVVNSKFVDYARAALVFIKEIEGRPVTVRCIGVSGMLNKVQKI